MADGIYDYARDDVSIPAKSKDELANIVIRRFNEAVRWQSQELVGDKPLRQVLRDCYDQYNGNLSCVDQQIADEIGVDAYVNLTAMKSGLVSSYLLETLIQAGQLPWMAAPTPVPDLSASGEYEVLEMIQDEIEGGYRGDLRQLIGNLKGVVLRREYEKAETAADAMNKLMADQCLEGGWNNAMFGFLTDFTVYPFAIMQGPVPVMRPRLQWSGDRVVSRLKTFYEFSSISPWDFWYSPDSPDTQRGTGVFIRQRWTRQRLLDAAKIPSYDRNNIVKVLEETEQAEYDFRWLSQNPDQPGEDILEMWKYCSATVDVLVHYGFFSGRELSNYGVSDLDDLEFYNTIVTVINGWTIQVVVQKNPTIQIRPIHTASFYKTHDRIPSFSIPQRIRDVERCYLTVLRYLISNAYSASGPITEADYRRLAKYMTSEDIARIVPNSVYLVDGDVGANNPALRFTNIPSAMQPYLQVLQYFMELVDRISNIPAALHGTAVGSGVNRTFRGAAMLQGNAVKAIQSSVSNIDQTVFEPLGTLLYNYNMIYSDDDAVKGDCNIQAQGAVGLLQKEIDRQNSYEILQLTASAGQQLAQMPNGMAIMAWALNNVLGNMGVPKELLTDPSMAPALSPPQAEGGPAPSAPPEMSDSGAPVSGPPPTMM